MEPLTMMAIMGAAGLLKSAAVDAPKEARQRKLAAETQRYSPWTGLTAGPIQEADHLGTGMQYGMTGAMLGQSMQDHKTQQMLQEKNAALMDSEIMRNNAQANASSGSIKSPDVVRGAGAGTPSIYSQARKSPWDLGVNTRFSY